MYEEIVNTVLGLLTNPTQVVLFVFSCVFYQQWYITAKRLEAMSNDYIKLFKSHTDSAVKLSAALTLLAERLR